MALQELKVRKSGAGEECERVEKKEHPREQMKERMMLKPLTQVLLLMSAAFFCVV